MNKLDEFLLLEDDWDSYGAKKVSPRSVEVAREIINSRDDVYHVCPFSDSPSGICIYLTDKTEIQIWTPKDS